MTKVDARVHAEATTTNNAWPESNLDPQLDTQIDTNARLRRALRDQQVVLDNAGVGIVFIRQRTVLRCNHRFAEIFSFSSAARAVGHTSQSLYPSESSFHALGKAAYTVMALGQTFKSEVLMRRRNGDLFWTHLTGKLVNPDVVDEGSIWIVEDISAQKNDQMKLQNLLTQQNLILDNAMVGIVFLRDRKVTQCNRSFEKLFGYEPGELLGSSSRRWYRSDQDWVEAGQRFSAPFAVGEAFESEMRDAGVDWRLIKYGGAVHSFTDRRADGSMKGAKYDEKAWAYSHVAVTLDRTRRVAEITVHAPKTSQPEKPEEMVAPARSSGHSPPSASSRTRS